MKAVCNHNDAATELMHIGTMVERLEQLVQRESVDWRGTGFATPAHWRARTEANAELPAAPQPRARLATLEAWSQRRSNACGGERRARGA